MTRGGGSRTPGASDESAQLIFPLVATPSRRRKWGKRVAIGIAAGCVLVLVAVVAQLRAPSEEGEWSSVEARVRDPLPGPAPAAGSGAASVFDLEPGTCIRELGDGPDVVDVAVVPCDVEHRAEVVATLRLPDGGWPGSVAVDEFAARRCVPLIEAAGITAPDELKWSYFGPSEVSWRQRADRTVSCLVVSRDVPLTRSLIDDPGRLP